MADKTYLSKHDGLMVKTTNGRFDTVYRGGALPSDADPDHVRILLDRGLIAEGEAAGGLDVDPDAAPPFPAPEEETRSSRRSAAAKED